MSDQQRRDQLKEAGDARPAREDIDALRVDEGPLKTEGDALRDGSGSRHGQSPPNVEPAQPH